MCLARAITSRRCSCAGMKPCKGVKNKTEFQLPCKEWLASIIFHALLR